MLLKSLKLENFRQFKYEREVIFATDPHNNVTVIMGENGSGKTTLAQAFTWCLYGETDFEDKFLLNKITSGQLMPEELAKVRVDMNLIHGGTEYTITREQAYKKDLSGRIKAQNTVFNIAYKKDGQQEFLKPTETDMRMKEILPKELSKYFFFDGERIGNMSKEIKKGKSQEFAQAVRSLLGLNAFVAAIEHLKPTSKNGVIGSYNESYDSSSDKKIAHYTTQIQDMQDQIDRVDTRINEIENEVSIAAERCEELKIKLLKNSESQKLQEEKEKLKKQVDTFKQSKISAISSLTKHFNTHAASYFAKSLIKDALENLSTADKLDKGIPDMHARTIEFLIKRGVCVCGNKIEFGNNEYNELNKALEFLPPHSIGMVIAQFIKESELRTKSSDLLFNEITEKYALIRDYENSIDDKKLNIHNIEEKLVGMEKVAHLQQELRRYEKVLRDLDAEKSELNQKKGSLETSRDRKMSEREELALRDEKNRKIEIYKAYAQSMYDEILRVYKHNENLVREKLQQYINEIFRNIYEGGLLLTIDEKYNIQIAVNDTGGYDTDIETSTAQSISVIFAFISGIIKMARENSSALDSETRMLESEPYPLVMDAPLSSFDKRRIQTVCETLPQIAEQVIIFIKDTDGELAEEHLGAKVGKRYIFEKKNELVTIIMPR